MSASKPFEKEKSLLGKQVRVKLGVNTDGTTVYADGQLVAFDNHGEVMLRSDAGVVTWSWPNLEMEELCPGYCGCRLGTDDADRHDCGCDEGCCD
jgi:hypothetical protein